MCESDTYTLSPAYNVGGAIVGTPWKKLESAGGKATSKTRPQDSDLQAAAFTCGSIRIVDYSDATDQHGHTTNIYRLALGEFTSCFSTDEAGELGDTPKMHCVSKQALKSCHTKSINTGSYAEQTAIEDEQGISSLAASPLMKETYINAAFQALVRMPPMICACSQLHNC